MRPPPTLADPRPLTFPWMASRLMQGHSVAISGLSDFPPEARRDAESFASLGVHSNVTMPIHVAGQFVSVLSFSTLHAEREWPAPMLARMRLLADIFGSLPARRRAQDRIDELQHFERLLVGISASLVSADPELTDAELQQAMGAVGKILRADRLRIWRVDPDAARLSVVRQWPRASPGSEGALAAIDEDRAMHGVLVGRVVRMDARSKGSGPDACPLLAIPLFARSAVVGALSFAHADGDTEWPDELLPRLEVFGNTLAGAIARREAEEAARRATRETAEYLERLAHLARVDAVGTMSAAIAHEVNQPLAAIRNYALAAQRRLAGDGRIDRTRLLALLEKIAGQAGAAGDVIDRIRAMVKRRDPRQVQVRVAELLENALGLIEIAARRQGVRVQTRLAPGLPPVLGDEVQLQQVIMNLAHNAVEAMSGVAADKRVLRLAANVVEGGRVQFEIGDTGLGIPPEDAERVFEPFCTTRSSGLGIGLAICRTLVEAHGGELWYEPQAGGGSLFRFTVPAAPEGP